MNLNPKRPPMQLVNVKFYGVNVKSRLIKLVLLPLWYGNKDIIRDTLS